MMWRRRAENRRFESKQRWAAIALGIARFCPIFALLSLGAAASEEPVPDIEPPSFEGRLDETGLLEPCTGPDDWIHLTSGEWLHGDLLSFKYKWLEFDSERMNLNTIKWKYVVELCNSYPMRFITDDLEVITGTGRMRGDTVYVWVADGSRVEIPRSRLYSILRGEPTEWNRWTFKASLGVDANTGNTNQTNFNTALDVKRKSATSLLAGNYQLSLGSVNNEDTVNRHQAELRGQRDITRQLYFSVLDIGLLSDEFQNISLRAIPGSGLGYRFFDRGNFEFEIEADAIYQYTGFVSAPTGFADSSNDAGNRISARLRWDITGDLESTINHATTLIYTDFRLSSYNTRFALIYDLTDILKLEFRINHNRVQEPIPDAQGVVPKTDDLQAIISFGLDLRP